MSLMPPAATGHETYADLNHANAGPQHVMNRVNRTLWNLPNIVESSSDEPTSEGNGNADLVEINSSEICGFTLDATNESYGHLWIYPDELDLSGDIDFRVIWSESGTGGSGSAQYTVVYTPIAFDTTAMAVGATALDTVIAADAPSTTANCVQASPWGTLDGSTLDSTTYASGESALAIKTYVTLTTITDATVYNLQARYYRKYIG